jgi:hypothetical protein
MAYKYNPLLPLGLDLSGSGSNNFSGDVTIDGSLTMLNSNIVYTEEVDAPTALGYLYLGLTTEQVTIGGGATDVIMPGTSTTIDNTLNTEVINVTQSINSITPTQLGYLTGITGPVEEGVFRTVKVTISSAEILAMGVTPVQLLPAPGAGKTYLIGETIVRYNAVTTAYATNTTLRVIYAGATVPIATNGVLLTSTVTRVGYLAPSPTTGTSNIHYAINAALQATIQTGNPTAGDGTIDVYVTYKTITL